MMGIAWAGEDGQGRAGQAREGVVGSGVAGLGVAGLVVAGLSVAAGPPLVRAGVAGLGAAVWRGWSVGRAGRRGPGAGMPAAGPVCHSSGTVRPAVTASPPCPGVSGLGMVPSGVATLCAAVWRDLSVGWAGGMGQALDCLPAGPARHTRGTAPPALHARPPCPGGDLASRWPSAWSNPPNNPN